MLRGTLYVTERYQGLSEKLVAQIVQVSNKKVVKGFLIKNL